LAAILASPEDYPVPVSERSYRLHGSEPAAAGTRRIARGRAQHAAERLRTAGPDDLADAVHGARKDLKKLRAVLRLLRAELGEKAFKRENRRYRDAGRLLSASRDAEVKLQTLRELRHHLGAKLPAHQASAWEGMLAADRDRIASSAGGEVAARVQEALDAIEEGDREIDSWPLHEDGWRLLSAGLEDGYRAGRDQLRVVRDGGPEEEVHQLRKRVKDLWYQLRLLVEAWPGPLAATIAEVDAMAEALGQHRDLALLAADLGERGDDLGERAEIEALLAERQAELLERALAIGARVYAEKPKAFRRRMRAYWRAWRPE
jgi:CHAD domain-containing protein